MMEKEEDEQTEQDETETYLRTSTEEELKSSTEEDYDEDEPFEEYNDQEEWTTQSSHLTEEEENTLFIAFINEDIEDQKNIWINAKTNLAKILANKETDEREEEILDRIVPTELVDLDETFDEEETDDLSDYQPYNFTMDQEEDFVLKDYQ